MFTGIVQAVGRIVRDDPLEVESQALGLADVAIGDSICVQGVCLTVTRLTGRGFTADVSAETRSLTAGLRAPAEVNLEKSLTLAGKLGGHLVTGHVDGIGEVVSYADGVLAVRLPAGLARYVARKGSICVDGVSLTVNRVEGDTFEAMLIPHTLAVTTFGGLVGGETVNVEMDVIGKYLQRSLALRGAP